MARQLKNWLSAYLDYTERSEPPQSFLMWSGLVCIASVLQRKVYLKWGFDTIYPNLYVVFVAPSGWSRKATPLKIIRDILENVHMNISSDSITKEALTRNMAASKESFDDTVRKAISFQSPYVVLSPELSVFLGAQDGKFLAALTDMYDCPPKWTYETKGKGKDEIWGPYLVMLGATAPDWLPMIIPPEAIGGGFTSRVIWICEDQKRKIVVVPRRTEDESRLRLRLIHDLELIKLMSGEVILEESMLKAYEKWYIAEHAKRYRPNDPLLGYRSRRATLSQKLAIISSVSRGDDMVVTKEDFDLAVKIMDYTEDKMNVNFGASGKSKHAEATLLVHNYMIEHKVATDEEILNAHYLDLDTYTLDIAIANLSRMHQVKVESLDPANNKRTLRYVGELIAPRQHADSGHDVGGFSGVSDASKLFEDS